MATGDPSGSRGTVLVVEDDPAIAELQRLYLTRDGFGVRVERSGAGALQAARSLRPVAIVLDIGLSGSGMPDSGQQDGGRSDGIDGVEVCRRLRSGGDDTPILFVTARDDEADRVLGLELGADDYITKPFSPRELVARVRAILRRGRADTHETLRAGGVLLDVDSRSVSTDGVAVELTTTEFELLAYLVRHPGRVYSREHLLEAVWGYPVGARTVDVHIAQLRAKLGPSCPIRTVRGVGYAATR
jgi:DNA-binding response OmpR family regulator